MALTEEEIDALKRARAVRNSPRLLQYYDAVRQAQYLGWPPPAPPVLTAEEIHAAWRADGLSVPEPSALERLDKISDH